MRGLSSLLTLFLIALAHTISAQTTASQTPAAHFVGSTSCRSCHAKEFDGWKQTRMANIIRSPQEHPGWDRVARVDDLRSRGEREARERGNRQ